MSEGGLVEAEVSQEPAPPARLLCCEARRPEPGCSSGAARPPLAKAWHTARPSAIHERTLPGKGTFTPLYVWATCPCKKYVYWHAAWISEGSRHARTQTHTIQCLERFPSSPHKTSMRADCPHQLPVEHSEWMLQCMHQYEQFF